jgi:zinc protease
MIVRLPALLAAALAAVLGALVAALPARAELRATEVRSPGGITAWLVEDHAIPFLALEVRFRGGTSLDPPGRRGVTNLMSALLEEGTGDLDAQGFAAARDALAAEFSFDAGADTLAVSARMLTENRDAAAALLAAALAAPRFDADAIERVRAQVLANIAGDDQDPGALAFRALDRIAFGNHPYGSDGDGTAASVAALTRDDIVAAHRAAIARDRIHVAAAGDITADELGRLLDILFAGLPAAGAPPPPKVEWQAPAGVTVEPFPVPQSVVVFGQAGIARLDPDFFAAFVLNEILGGGRFSARLMTELREKRGLTYGIGTWLAPLDLGAWWGGQFASDNARVAEAIEVVRAEWARAARGEISAEEVEAAKTYMIGSYPLRFDGNGAIADILVGMQVQGLPIDYALTRNAQVAAVTVEDVRRVAARLMRPEALHFVVVGEPAGLAPAAGVP